MGHGATGYMNWVTIFHFIARVSSFIQFTLCVLVRVSLLLLLVSHVCVCGLFFGCLRGQEAGMVCLGNVFRFLIDMRSPEDPLSIYSISSQIYFLLSEEVKSNIWGPINLLKPFGSLLYFPNSLCCYLQDIENLLLFKLTSSDL